jgi:hypothetical protein
VRSDRASRSGTRVLLRAGIALAVLSVACAPETTEELTPACSDADSDPSKAVDYKTQVRPLLWKPQNGANRCTSCHLSTYQEGSTPVYLFLDSYALLRKGSKTAGAVVLPGKPCASLLLKKLRGTAVNGARMPRGGPYFTPEQIALVSDWIAEGAMGED